MSPDIEIIGDGCAALSLAARASELNQNLTIIKPSNAPPTRDHVWGFWSDPCIKSCSIPSKINLAKMGDNYRKKPCCITLSNKTV